MQPNNPPTPERIFETIIAYQQSAVLKGAIELDVFTAIAEGANTADQLAEKCHASVKGMRVLCDYLTVKGFLTKEGQTYALAPDAAFYLSRHSPAYAGAVSRFLLSPTLMSTYDDIAATVRKGGTVISDEGTVEDNHPVWVDFARGMGGMMAMPAQLIAQLIDAASMASCKVLDIAAGHGMFGIAIAQANPHAEIVAVDWQAVLAVAKENAEKMGVADRLTCKPGSAFEVEFGDGYDLVLLTNFFHHFDVPTCEGLMKKVHAALKPSGRAVTFEFVPNEDRVSPPQPATFAMVMLASTANGDAYTFAEYEKMFANAGFASTELHQLPPTFQQVLISHK
ncbi:MAG: class I SAM-dependent methyltransferase [Acidobacteriota bacterium]